MPYYETNPPFPTAQTPIPALSRWDATHKGYTMKMYTILGIAGSLRTASTNKGLLRCAVAHAPAHLNCLVADLSDIPFYNADIATPPPPVQRLLDQFAAADALLLACAEYNYSMAPALKNALDWASRQPNNALLEGKPAAIMGAGAGMGSSRAQYHLRQTCVFLNLHVMNKPEFFANAYSGIFDDAGNLTSADDMKRMSEFMAAVGAWVEKMRG